MKRFIKTIDGHVYDTSEMRVCEHLAGSPLEPKSGWLVYREDIVKESDDLLDLCDVYVVWDTVLSVFTHYSDYEEATFGDMEYEVVYALTEYVDKNEIFHTRTVAIRKPGEDLRLCSQERL